MTIQDILVIAVCAFAVIGALSYLYKKKKKGCNCVGCPYSGDCHKHH